ncbi:MAG: iron uptake protein [Duganella sp.]
MATAPISRLNIASRTLAAVLGGYAFTWGLIAFGMAAMVAADMEFHDAEHLTAIIGFLVFLTIFLTAFAARNITRVWLFLVAGAGVMTLCASLIQRQVV